jgi:polyphosphate kinase
VSPELLLNRELSWLAWNARVLALAADPSLPLLERTRFCAIFSRNLDEFFMVRVAGLLDQIEAGVNVTSPDARRPQETLSEVRERVLQLTARQSKLWKRDLSVALEEAGIIVGQVEDCTKAELDELGERFEHEVFPILTPLAVGPGQPFPYISGLSLSLGLFVRDPDSGEERFARVKVPELLPRFMGIGERGLFLPLERVIRHFLGRLFPKMEILECCIFRVTRDADFELSDEADDLREAVEDELRRRRFGDAVRVEITGSASARMLARLKRGLAVSDDQVYLVQGLLDLESLSEFVGLDRPDLKGEPWYPLTHPRFANVTSPDEFFAEVAKGDILVHQPYHAFGTSFEALVNAAATDDDSLALKTTVYRTSGDSPLVPALIEATEKGKQAVCLVELKARFDERRNIGWARALEQAGVHVVYGFPNLKIHAKTTLVVRREGGELHRYAHVGTGNYHAATARSYEDFGLFTADPEVTADVADLFNFLTGFSRPTRFRKLLVAPFDLRERLVEKIRATATAAAAGEKARIRIKVNNLTDETIIEELYKASQKGVEVEILARSICTLRPGVEGLSDNIRVVSVLGRFLEHSRVFVFQAGDTASYYLGSADLMPRNLDYRIEAVVPVEDPRAQQELTRALDTMVSSNVHAWELKPDGEWQRIRAKKGERSRDTQTLLMRSVRARQPRRASKRTTSRADQGGARGDRRPAEQNGADESRRRRRWREHAAPPCRRSRHTRELRSDSGGTAADAPRRGRRAKRPTVGGQDRTLSGGSAQGGTPRAQARGRSHRDRRHLTLAER